MNRFTLFMFSSVLLTFVSFLSSAQEQSSSPFLVGKTTFLQYCATCHGMDRRGGNSSTLFDTTWQFGSSRKQIVENINNGIESRGMPAYRDVLSDRQVDDLVKYMEAMQAANFPIVENISSQVETLDYIVKVEHWVDTQAGLKSPWAIDFIDPETALVTEQPGPLRLVVNGVLHPDPIVGTPEVLYEGQGGMMDVAVDPDYKQNGWIYLGFTHALGKGKGVPAMTKIVRGRIVDHRWTDEQTLFEANHSSYLPTRYHFGTRIVFDPRGDLYFAIGDRGAQDQAQDLSRPNGKIHRIHRNGSIPDDNPFVKQVKALPSIFSYGHRNPQGMAIHPQTGQLWALEHGPRGGDELNLCLAGKNYGWPVITYGINYNGTIITKERKRAGMEQPVYYWRPSIAVCGADFYRGDMFPYWKNCLLVATLKYRELRLLNIENDRVIHEEIILKDVGRIREAVGGPEGAVYVVLNEPDEILRLSMLKKAVEK